MFVIFSYIRADITFGICIIEARIFAQLIAINDDGWSGTKFKTKPLPRHCANVDFIPAVWL